ncbi:MAG TPA: hypothetical protein VE978_27270 [Chitinophagales bacterium]|nr:hypothetical protein [Chitinophagales bacterium]
MNRYFFSGLIICVMLSSCHHNKLKEKSTEATLNRIDSVDTDTVPRKSITFILGKDESSRNPYYSLADQYYRLGDSEKTEIVIDTLISLLEVRNYLAAHRPENGHPWGLINLVTHGNEFIDLSVYVSPTGSRVSEESLQEAIADTIFKPLDSLTIDKKTLFNLHGCAVGHNKGLLRVLGIAFGGNKNPARVKASKMFEYYAYLSQNKNPQMIRHYYARVWYAYYKVDSFPGEAALAEQLKTRYPNDSVDWIRAIRRQYPSNPSEAYHINLNIPVLWEDFYDSKDSLPDLRTKAKQSHWLESKTELLALMKKTRIPQNYFSIKFYTLTYNSDSATVYSSKVKAKAGVICIIEPVLRRTDSQQIKYLPFVPSAEDSMYFTFTDNGKKFCSWYTEKTYP